MSNETLWKPTTTKPAMDFQQDPSDLLYRLWEVNPWVRLLYERKWLFCTASVWERVCLKTLTRGLSIRSTQSWLYGARTSAAPVSLPECKMERHQVNGGEERTGWGFSLWSTELTLWQSHWRKTQRQDRMFLMSYFTLQVIYGCFWGRLHWLTLTIKQHDIAWVCVVFLCLKK